MKMKHEGFTPGPWKTSHPDINPPEILAGARTNLPWIAVTCEPQNEDERDATHDERHANARLMADAPNLFARVNELERIIAEAPHSFHCATRCANPDLRTKRHMGRGSSCDCFKSRAALADKV